MKPQSKPRLVGPDGASPTAPLSLTGVVKTSRGFAVARATFAPDGSLIGVELQRSQAFKQYVAAEHKRLVVSEALKA